MAGVQNFRLNNLNINIKNALIVGIIIAKNSPRIFESKKKSGESRGVTSFTIRDSEIDTINVDVWGSDYFVTTFYERFLVGDVVEISSPKICIKSGANENYRPHVTSPFYLSLNEGFSDVCIHSGNEFGHFLPLLHIPTKPSSGYHGLAEILKLPESTSKVYVDLLVVVKSVKPVKTIKTRTGVDMTVRSVEIMDNTTPATLLLDLFDLDSIQRAEEWRPLESVLFVSDALVSWRRGARVQAAARSVLTHQPHAADAEALLLYIRNQAHTRGGEAAAWAAWSGERASAASVAQVKDRLGAGAPFCASLHALLTHLDLDELVGATKYNEEGQICGKKYLREKILHYDIAPFGQGSSLVRATSKSCGKRNIRIRLYVRCVPQVQTYTFCASLRYSRTSTWINEQNEEIRVRFSDHTGELNAKIPLNILEDTLGHSTEKLKSLSADERSALRWKVLLEQCSVRLAASPPRLIVLALRRASPADPIPLY